VFLAPPPVCVLLKMQIGIPVSFPCSFPAEILECVETIQCILDSYFTPPSLTCLSRLIRGDMVISGVRVRTLPILEQEPKHAK